ncbi:BamA/TamA family outer membrane protein [Sinomicrobium sp. FJxs]|uniref:BamA/TamA family outer membrane protein n=2 Tax=Sinomicrobium weinanense TaxID=2842200 RepID=A0A926Q4F4_9FLAO|nr:BamA/TamA family outer membrane protein [Sinomicrobium weinanense]MBC9797021.1 BamA/TamA family outer membrane protein [Sinomicrobium weinanense]MBU3123281.1 BamA/TamA family outer membrane protein [Sinomicrobium weinanense]
MASCNTVKRVNDDKLLLTKNNIYVNGEKEQRETVRNLISQHPNSSLLGFNLKLHIYNLATPKPDSSFQAWLYRKEKREQRLNRLLSRKQVIELGKSVAGFNKWLKETGEAPVVINKSKAEKSRERLNLYYNSKGYFNNTVTYSVDTVPKKKKRGEVNYEVTTGKPYFLDSITTKIESEDIDSIYSRYNSRMLIKEGEQFDLSHFEGERERINSILINSGIYQFQPNSSIRFNVLRDTLTANEDYKMPVEIEIDNRHERVGDSLQEMPYKIHRINKVNIFADYTFGLDKEALDSVTYDNFTIYYKDKLRYKPKALTDAVAITPENIYREIDRTRTYRQISSLNTFKYPNIEYLYANDSDDRLNTNIYLTHRPKFSLGLNTDISHSNIQDIGISFSTSLISRNVFRGAETLEVSVRGTVGSSRDASNPKDRFFNISEFGGDIRLNFPRIFFFFDTRKYIPKYMLPETRMSVGSSFQKNIGLDKQSFNTILRYNWTPSYQKKHTFELMNIEFIRNLNVDRYFTVYQNSYGRLNDIAQEYDVDPSYFNEDGNLLIPEGTNQFIREAREGGISGLTPGTDDFRTVSSIEERRRRLSANNLIFASNFTFTKNTRRGASDNTFSQFKAKLETAGNFLSAVSNFIEFDKNEDGKKMIFDVQYSQYVKTELDFIKHWAVSRRNIIAFRSFFGFAIPYGNASNIPFSRSYFAGGTNDNRAWQAYSLGPGRTDARNDFNEANLKIALNLEYRFNIMGSLNGAFFADAGNIWNALDDVTDEDATFTGFSSLKDIALGTGFGIRYDFGFFVIRVDTGFKTYDPAERMSRRWFHDYNFSNAVYNIGINYPF